MMSASILPAPRPMRWFAIAASVLMVLDAGASAQDSGRTGIPALASSSFGWQSNLEDWQDPPPGYGHGPMKNDPAYPFINNSVVDSPENAAVSTVDPNFGHIVGRQPTVRIANSKDPILKPWAAAAVQATNDEILQGKRPAPFWAQSRCWPGGVPGQLNYAFEPMYFIQKPGEVWMIWQRDHMVRRVYLNRLHSANVTPSWFGESVGHYENGNTLVVDTIGLSTTLSFIDNFRTPHSEHLHVLERFTLSPDGKMLTAIVRAEDPDAYNAPITMMRQWFKLEQPEMLEVVCAENNSDYFHQNLYPIPEANNSDF